ncbi:MAG TPA: alpha/beta fold hydrolase [Solirubrobacterales bacterium]|nr:alpha/beta fold hydrolase [Solirubrobacterales bacterium]
MSLLETSAGVIAYDERGEGQPLVMLPSGAHSRHDFDQLRELLAPRFRSIALDWPAHGDSPPGAGAASAMAFADAAEALVEAVAPDGAVVVGNSVGGFAAARLALRRPELVRGLVLVDAGGFAPHSPLVRVFCALMSRPGFLRRFYPAFARRYMRPRTEADRRALDAAVATTREDPGLRTVSELWASFVAPEHDLRAEAGSIAAPSLVVWGRRDPVIPLRIGKKVAASIPGAELVVLDAGHVPYATDPEGFASALVPFADAAFATVAGETV